MKSLSKINLFDFDQEHLKNYLCYAGEKPYRAAQIINWLHQRGVTNFDQMTNLSLKLRTYLAENTDNILPEIIDEQISNDGTRKFLFKLKDGEMVETVYIPERNRATLCISSQIGCPLNCQFCATATLGFKRNLTTAEIIGQLWQVIKKMENGGFAKDRIITNVVMMGMGEPLLNLDNVIRSLNLMMDDNAYGLSKYRVTVSSAGITPNLYKLRQHSNCSLAISLHAPNDELRSKIMPVNRKYPLKGLIIACKDFFAKEKRRAVTFEYVMLKDVNDSQKHAKELVKLLSQMRSKVNLIPFNSFPGCNYEPSTADAIEKFRAILIKAGINTIVRKARGDDIAGACGQLAAEVGD
ncbi:MAG: 23S rRNA (adenine(2503)-C(2))-methyltransferase RlmN [Gammaproteobacteria bacterium]|nr:23S rRNA (adenine(2503)-C(2))-methyltransferase RlmN [Gammaproteobacteria bacterium]